VLGEERLLTTSSVRITQPVPFPKSSTPKY
jgi:hypothetical protein